MAQRIVKKSLAGRQDILFGRGQVTQTRASGSYPITKIATLWVVGSYEELDLVDTTQFELVFVTDGTLWQHTAGYWSCLNADVYLAGSFAAGCTVTSVNGLVGTDTGLFRWTGDLPKEVAPSSLPIEPAWQTVELKFSVFEAALAEYSDDTAAAAGGIAVGGLYRTGSLVKVRVL